jgi:predicted RNase H-like nuclease (RuvC/YqgF family)
MLQIGYLTKIMKLCNTLLAIFLSVHIICGSEKQTKFDSKKNELLRTASLPAQKNEDITSIVVAQLNSLKQSVLENNAQSLELVTESQASRERLEGNIEERFLYFERRINKLERELKEEKDNANKLNSAVVKLMEITQSQVEGMTLKTSILDRQLAPIEECLNHARDISQDTKDKILEVAVKLQEIENTSQQILDRQQANCCNIA